MGMPRALAITRRSGVKNNSVPKSRTLFVMRTNNVAVSHSSHAKKESSGALWNAGGDSNVAAARLKLSSRNLRIFPETGRQTAVISF
jgi:hypothetical protein